jgi:hypothetical protein
MLYVNLSIRGDEEGEPMSDGLNRIRICFRALEEGSVHFRGSSG